ncbi:MAG: hypothetical protein ISS26_01025 [Candidatus Omnitrophica bacterium]|nr:hypothetical protein [Candidatus Omnitrophota bacterium]
MSTFDVLFGLTEKDIKKTCILMPLVARDTLRRLGIQKLSRGKLYSASNTGNFTLIRTGIGTHLLGDAVLYLEDTPCENILVFGSCGLIEKKRGLEIGSLVIPLQSHACESFTNVLHDKVKDCDVFYPDEPLIEELIACDKDKMIKKAQCVTFGSLKMEAEKLAFFGKQGIDVVDMECSALFAASRYIKRRAAALLYVTDIVEEQPFYAPLLPKIRAELIYCINYAIDTLLGFTKALSNK